MPQPTAIKTAPLPKPVEECDASGIHLEESGKSSMRDLKDELASLRINREEPIRRKWGRWIVLLVVVVAASAAGMYLVRTNPGLTNFAAVEVEAVPASVQTTLGPSAGTPILTASGYLVARHQSVISSKIQGRLSALYVEEGTYVKKDEVIARLEDTDYVAAVAKAKADIEYAKANLAEMERQARLQRGLYKEKVVSQDALDAADSRVALAKATIDQDKAALLQQQALLDFTVIRAPFDGVVVKKMAEVGESVAPIPPGVNISTSSGAIVAIADMNSLEAEVDVNEANVGELAQGYPADINVQAIPDHTYKGVLRQVIPTADRTKATVTVKVSILDKDRLIKPEMSCNVTFLEPQKKGDEKEAAPVRIVTIPKDAVTTRDGKQVVFTIEKNKAHEVAVVTGNELNGQIIIKSGLTGSESLVNNPPQKVVDGTLVKIKS
ncbi:MAG TPA: efflux RND transporter periplasmic adaptor subunit [Candidatus Eisenbacteria bacterium]|nr:efflux RND transporter periplasmic adaptor subunit [Candidatus Eisenbacteria bacterium]